MICMVVRIFKVGASVSTFSTTGPSLVKQKFEILELQNQVKKPSFEK